MSKADEATWINTLLPAASLMVDLLDEDPFLQRPAPDQGADKCPVASGNSPPAYTPSPQETGPVADAQVKDTTSPDQVDSVGRQQAAAASPVAAAAAALDGQQPVVPDTQQAASATAADSQPVAAATDHQYAAATYAQQAAAAQALLSAEQSGALHSQQVAPAADNQQAIVADRQQASGAAAAGSQQAAAAAAAAAAAGYWQAAAGAAAKSSRQLLEVLTMEGGAGKQTCQAPTWSTVFRFHLEPNLRHSLESAAHPALGLRHTHGAYRHL